MSKTFIKKESEYYDSCKVLPLRIFFEISESGDVELLGKADKSILVDAWESIIIEYGKLDENQGIQNVIDKSDDLYNKAALYCEIKAMLLYLAGADKQEYVDRLAELGYKVNTKTRKDKWESLQKNDRRANHINTRMQFLQKELELMTSDKKASFDGVMTFLSSELGFEPKEDITVLRFIEYKKRIREKRKKK